MGFEMLTGSIAEIIVIVLGILLTRYLIPYLKEKYGSERAKNTYDMIEKAVFAAQKLYQESGQGPLRKQYVIDYINSNQKLIKLSEKELDILIESAVKLLDIFEAELKV
jgi:LL-H family phage holin